MSVGVLPCGQTGADYLCYAHKTVTIKSENISSFQAIFGTHRAWTDSSRKTHAVYVDPAKRSLRKLGNRIRTLRKARGWSQEEFALEANLARSYIGGVERGERNLSFINIARIAGALSISISVLCETVPNIQPD